jgi:UDP-glucuronate decarboxylase
VTGAAGYIGGWLLAELTNRGHEVHAQDLVRPHDAANFGTWRTFDLASPQRHDWLRATEPEVVIHLAALYGRVWGETDMVKTAGINAGLTAQLARDCAAAGIRLMFMSSSEVYGETANHRTCYTDARHGLVAPLQPLNMYGMSKKWGEEAAARYAPDGLMITRLNMPYGPSWWHPRKGERTSTSGQPGTVGYNVLHSMVWEAEVGFDLVVHQGTERCLTWVGDTVRGLAMILESGQAGTWNVNRNDDHRQVADIARAVVDMTGSTSKISVEDPPPRVTMRKSLDNTGLLELGWAPTVELDEGMKRTWEYFRRFDRNGVWQG